MADSYNVKKITELAAKSASDDTDLYVVGNQGTATMRKISFATIAAAVRDKLTSLTFPSLNTSNKTLPGAVNELNSNTVPLMGTQSVAWSATAVNANTNITAGAYQVGIVNNVSNLPAGVQYGILTVLKARGYIVQEYFDLPTKRKYRRHSTNTGASWSEWYTA